MVSTRFDDQIKVRVSAALKSQHEVKLGQSG